MDDLLECFEASLDHFGVAAQVHSSLPALLALPTAQVTKACLTRGASDQDYVLLHGPAVRFADTAGAGDAGLPLLVFTMFVATRTAAAFRRAGVQYLDSVGNASIAFGDVFIDVRGRSRPGGRDKPARTAEGNLFSTGRAQVVFALLAWPHLWNAPQREVAHAAGVSLGQAHNTLTLLGEIGYGRERVQAHQTELLDLWAAAFPIGLAKKLTLATYRGEIGTVKTPSTDDPAFVSGECAVDDVIRPATLTLYVEKLDPRLPITNKWRSDGRANIVVRRKFWHAPDINDASLVGVGTAPWPLVYADLLCGDDPRVRTTAKEWRDRFAGSDYHA